MKLWRHWVSTGNCHFQYVLLLSVENYTLVILFYIFLELVLKKNSFRFTTLIRPTVFWVHDWWFWLVILVLVVEPLKQRVSQIHFWTLHHHISQRLLHKMTLYASGGQMSHYERSYLNKMRDSVTGEVHRIRALMLWYAQALWSLCYFKRWSPGIDYFIIFWHLSKRCHSSPWDIPALFVLPCDCVTQWSRERST